jgi:hypothetical protein
MSVQGMIPDPPAAAPAKKKAAEGAPVAQSKVLATA